MIGLFKYFKYLFLSCQLMNLVGPVALASDGIKSELAQIHKLANYGTSNPLVVRVQTSELRRIGVASERTEVKNAAIRTIINKSSTWQTSVSMEAMEEIFHIAILSDSGEVHETAIRALSSKFQSLQIAKRQWAIELIYKIALQISSPSARQLAERVLEAATFIRGGDIAIGYLEEIKQTPLKRLKDENSSAGKGTGIIDIDALWWIRKRSEPREWKILVEKQLGLTTHSREYIHRVEHFFDDLYDFQVNAMEAVGNTIDHFLELKPKVSERKALDQKLSSLQERLRQPEHWRDIGVMRIELAQSALELVELLKLDWSEGQDRQAETLFFLRQLSSKLKQFDPDLPELNTTRRAIREFRGFITDPEIWGKSLKLELELAVSADDFFHAIHITDWWGKNQEFQEQLKAVIEENLSEKFLKKNPSLDLRNQLNAYFEFVKRLSKDPYWNPCRISLGKI